MPRWASWGQFNTEPFGAWGGMGHEQRGQGEIDLPLRSVPVALPRGNTAPRICHSALLVTSEQEPECVAPRPLWTRHH